ncbi:MAG TPA: hypothetical protein VMV68_04070 [Spirochaetia bacterium]|nr:hypothetical protein [Spirochaetia bacterium]
MRAMLRGLKAVYEFFAGDAILLAFAAVAFLGTALLVHVLHAANWIAAVALVGIISVGLFTTLDRERRAGRDR